MLEETCWELAELAGVWVVWLEQAAKRPRTASEARERVSFLDNENVFQKMEKAFLIGLYI